MAPRSNFNLRQLALIIAAIHSPLAFAAPAGRVEFATGEPVVIGSDGRERPARKGEPIVSGDRVMTRAGRAQLAFADGAFVSLQPNTDFGVEEYHFKGSNDGSEKSIFSLMKGALRTVTGLIGRGKREAYVMKTPTATIGIRGTGGRIEVNEQGTFILGTSGTWFMSTPGGTIDIPAGTAGFAGTDRNAPPRTTSIVPNTPPAGPSASSSSGGSGGMPPPVYVAAEQITSSGTVATVVPTAPAAPTTMADGSGYGISYTNLWLTASPTLDIGATATFNAGTALTSWNSPMNSVAPAQIDQSGNDGLIGWGRWTGSMQLDGSPYTGLGGEAMHYVVGMPTAVMPTSPGTVPYTQIGATTPTIANASVPSPASVSASFSADFSVSQLNYSITATVGGLGYTASGTNVAFTGNTFSNSGISYAGSACASGCNGAVQGIFTGSAADRVGLIYSIESLGLGSTAAGAIAFKK